MNPIIRTVTTASFIILAAFAAHSQKRTLSIPFEFEKSLLEKGDYDTYFLNNDFDSSFALVIKDNKKIQYVQVDKGFKIVTKIDLSHKSSVFNEDIVDYRGGTTNGNISYFVYEEKEKKVFGKDVTHFQMETVDFGAKTVTHTDLFQIPKAETVVSSFSENNTYYTFTADNKSKELVVYIVDQNGKFRTKRFPFIVPSTAGKSRNSISEYFQNLSVVSMKEETDLSTAASSAKVFVSENKLQFLLNDKENPVHIFTVSLPDLTASEKFIDFSSFQKGKKDIAVNSFIHGDRLYSLVLDKKQFDVIVHELSSGSLVSKFEFADEESFSLLAELPITTRRLGSKVKANDLEKMKSVIKAFEKGKEGIMISINKKGQLIVTVGTYDMIQTNYGNTGGWETKTVRVNPTSTNGYQSFQTDTHYNINYRPPGQPTYTSYSARYYTTTTLKLILEPSAQKIVRGTVPTSLADQIKDYIESIDKKAKATNQFSIGKRQFYGYYERDTKSYVVDEIRIRS